MLTLKATSIESGHASHAGRRPDNQDAWRVMPVRAGDLEKGRLFAVADGMGGELGGGLASRLACQGLDSYYQDRVSENPPWSARLLGDHLQETVLRIDRYVRWQGYLDAALAHMGTTLSCLVLTGAHSIIAHVGDSRIYRLRQGYLTCMTTDHTFVQDMVFEGEVDPARAAEHPLRHLLTRVVGTAEPLDYVDTRVDPLKDGDRFLLCTDGLHNSLGPEHISPVLNQPWHARKIASTLVGEALQSGARDNITALVLKT